MIFQEPLLALDPVYTLRATDHRVDPPPRTGFGPSEARARALALFEQVRIPEP
jgi:peptide/nickel transport system ATP-binding protein